MSIELDVFRNEAPEKLLEFLELEEPPFDPFEMAEKMDIAIDSIPDFDNLDKTGQLSVDENGNATIWVNPMVPYNLQRFIVAHEIAHYVMHTEKGVSYQTFDFPAESEMMPDREAVANAYAAGLLMPENAVFEETDRIFEKAGDSGVKAGDLINRISKVFQVPEKVAHERLLALGFGFDG